MATPKTQVFKIVFEMNTMAAIFNELQKMTFSYSRFNQWRERVKIFMPQQLRIMLLDYMAIERMTLDRNSVEFNGYEIIDGYENAIVICCPDTATFQGSPILAIEKIGTDKMSIVDRTIY
jgi:hypothetical protein